MNSKNRRTQIRTTLKRATACLALAGFIAGFQNCGPTFQMATPEFSQISPQSELESNSEPPFGVAPPIAATYQPVGVSNKCNPSDPGMSEVAHRRLSRTELINTYAALFGASFVQGINHFDLLPKEIRGDLFFGSDFSDVETMYVLADRVMQTYFEDSQRIGTLLPGCANGFANTTCQTAFFKLADRIFRRKLEATEIQELKNLVQALGSDLAAIRFGLVRLLAAPHFHQLIETAQTSLPENCSKTDGAAPSGCSDGRAQTSQFEIASRLSYRLTGFPPDDILFTAASESKLKTIADIEFQAKRLVGTAQARTHFVEFAKNWLEVDQPADPDSAVATQFGFSSTGLGQEYLAEFENFVDHLVFVQEATLPSLYTSKLAFATTDRLAKVFSVARNAQPQEAMSSHAGVLLRPAVLSTGSTRTPLVHRGLRFRTRVLCGHVLEPDGAALAIGQERLEQLSPEQYSRREIMTQATAGTTCIGCHSQMNPIGFVLEEFGPLGQSRLVEEVFDNSGNVIAQHSLNLDVDDLSLPGRSGVGANRGLQLVQEVAQTEAALRCFSQQLFARTRNRNQQESDGCVVEKMTDGLKQGGSLKNAFIGNVVNEDIFWRRIIQGGSK